MPFEKHIGKFPPFDKLIGENIMNTFACKTVRLHLFLPVKSQSPAQTSRLCGILLSESCNKNSGLTAVAAVSPGFRISGLCRNVLPAAFFRRHAYRCPVWRRAGSGPELKAVEVCLLQLCTNVNPHIGRWRFLFRGDDPLA